VAAPPNTVAYELRALRMVYGASLLLAPSPALQRVAPAPVDRTALAVARVLGARHLIQAAALGRHPARARLLAGTGIDVSHAASMAVVARCSRRPAHRRLAAGNARTAALFAAGGAMAFVNASISCQSEVG
jgi:hypothetical protein